VIRQKFFQRGWVIGKTRQNDVCPQCLARVVTDRAARHNTAKAEAKRATADLVIAEGRTPHPAHSLTPDNVELSRQQLMLLDRTAEIYRVASYVSAQVEELINRIADLEGERDSLVRRITTMTGQTPATIIEDQPMPFERLQNHYNTGIKVGYYASTHQTVISINPAITDQAKLDKYVTLSVGEGSDAGIIRVEPAPPNTAGQNGVYKLGTEPGGVKRLSLSQLRPTNNLQMSKTEVRHRVQPDGLYIRLPAAFTSSNGETNGIQSSHS
jgi:hypothetical protein